MLHSFSFCSSLARHVGHVSLMPSGSILPHEIHRYEIHRLGSDSMRLIPFDIGLILTVCHAGSMLLLCPLASRRASL